MINPFDKYKKTLLDPPLPYWVNEFISVGGKINPDSLTVWLYHATTKEKAAQIVKDGVLRRPSNTSDTYGVYLSSSPSIWRDYGDGTVVPVKVRIKDLTPDDVFPGRRMDFNIPTRHGIYRPVVIGALLYQPQ